jgi:hypothetical protein
MMSNRLIIIIVFLSIIIYGCSYSNKAPKQNHRDDLIVIKGAKDIKYYNLHGTEQVSYRVSMAYPAGTALVEISERLKARGWEPLTESFLNPGLPSSHVTGWGWFEDGTKPFHPWIYQWLADWKNNNGDILSFVLRYESINKKAILLKNNNLQIYGIFTTASLAEADREAILKKKPPPSNK